MGGKRPEQDRSLIGARLPNGVGLFVHKLGGAPMMVRSSQEAVDFLLESTLTLAEVEANGFRVDMEYLDRTIGEIEAKIADVHARMKKSKEWRLWTKKIPKPNIGSHEQLGKLLFTHMGLKPKKYTAGSYDDAGSVKVGQARAATDKEALADIDLPFVKDFLKAKNLEKTLSTYLYGLKREAVKDKKGDWYVRPLINLNTASSFRSSEQLPNLQNQPKRDEEMMRFVRKAFLPHPGHHLVDFDYKTLEVFVGYFYHRDPAMKKYLTDPTTDMHRDAASDLFMIPIPEMIRHAAVFKKSIRDSAKNQFVFPEFYGSVYFQCAKNIWEAMERKKWTMPGQRVREEVKVKGSKSRIIYHRDKLVKEHLADRGVTSLGRCDPNYDSEEGTFEHHVKEVERKLWKRFAGYARWKKDYYQRYLDKGYFRYLNGFVIAVPHKRNDVTNYCVQGTAYHCLQWSMNKVVKELKRRKLKSKVVNEIHDSMSLSVPPNELQTVINLVVKIMTVKLRKHWKWIRLPLEVEVEVASVDRPWSEQKQYVKVNGVWELKP